mgnify:CR=1 FL=1
MKHVNTFKLFEDAQKTLELNAKIRELDSKRNEQKAKAADTAKKQREEGNGTQGYYERHQPDDIDMDGMGNQGRFNATLKPKATKRKKGSQSRQKNYTRKFKQNV